MIDKATLAVTDSKVISGRRIKSDFCQLQNDEIAIFVYDNLIKLVDLSDKTAIRITGSTKDNPNNLWYRKVACHKGTEVESTPHMFAFYEHTTKKVLFGYIEVIGTATF